MGVPCPAFQAFHFSIGVHLHDSTLFAIPAPIPAPKMPHLTFSLLRGVTGIFTFRSVKGGGEAIADVQKTFAHLIGSPDPADLAPGETARAPLTVPSPTGICSVQGPVFGEFVQTGTDAFPLVPHLPLPPVPFNLVLPIILVFGSSAAMFGASSVTFGGEGSTPIPNKSDGTACGLIPYAPLGLTAGCNDPFIMPELTICPTTVFVGANWDDVLALVVELAIAGAIDGLMVGLKMGGGAIKNKAKKAYGVRKAGKAAAAAGADEAGVQAARAAKRESIKAASTKQAKAAAKKAQAEADDASRAAYKRLKAQRKADAKQALAQKKAAAEAARKPPPPSIQVTSPDGTVSPATVAPSASGGAAGAAPSSSHLAPPAAAPASEARPPMPGTLAPPSRSMPSEGRPPMAPTQGPGLAASARRAGDGAASARQAADEAASPLVRGPGGIAGARGVAEAASDRAYTSWGKGAKAWHGFKHGMMGLADPDAPELVLKIVMIVLPAYQYADAGQAVTDAMADGPQPYTASADDGVWQWEPSDVVVEVDEAAVASTSDWKWSSGDPIGVTSPAGSPSPDWTWSASDRLVP